MQFIEPFDVYQRSQWSFKNDAHFFADLAAGSVFNRFARLYTAARNDEILMTVAPAVDEKDVFVRKKSDSNSPTDRGRIHSRRLGIDFAGDREVTPELSSGCAISDRHRSSTRGRRQPNLARRGSAQRTQDQREMILSEFHLRWVEVRDTFAPPALVVLRSGVRTRTILVTIAVLGRLSGWRVSTCSGSSFGTSRSSERASHALTLTLQE